MATITLANLFHQINVACDDQRIVQGISDDSRRVGKDWVFIARHGYTQNGAVYAQEALEKGAVVLWECEAKQDCYHCDDTKKALLLLLQSYYGHLCKHLCVIGVTGTNGKSSVSLLCSQMFQKLGKRTMVIGTGHIRYDDQEEPNTNTTPSACILAAYFTKAVEKKIPVLIMEVSSHAIDQQRIGWIHFDYIIYTNIASDHLDYHITRTHYHYTKFKLRRYLKRNGLIILNHDDRSLHPLYSFHDAKIVTVGQNQAHMQISDIHMTLRGTSFRFQKEEFFIQMLGMYNVYNVCQCLMILHDQHVSLKQQKEIASHLKGIAGRNEMHVFQGVYVCIDYAHTASSLCVLLSYLYALKEARMIVICGCGGNRDRKKRAKMAEIALKYADVAIFTTDNPRYEKPADILMDMIQGHVHQAMIFENRAYAIKYAVKIAKRHDIIVIAGKGEECTQSVKGRQFPFSDLECVTQMFGGSKYDT